MIKGMIKYGKQLGHSPTATNIFLVLSQAIVMIIIQKMAALW
jgi:hypothetical protein